MKFYHKKGFKKPERLNLVPIMDSVFIFIFFLLSSAQFIEMFEIDISTPITKEIEKQEDVKNFNLVVIPKEKEISIELGLEDVKKYTFNYIQRDDVIKFLLDLKKKYPRENTLRIRTLPEIDFEKAIQAIDLTQDDQLKTKLFTQIIFEEER